MAVELFEQEIPTALIFDEGEEGKEEEEEIVQKDDLVEQQIEAYCTSPSFQNKLLGINFSNPNRKEVLEQIKKRCQYGIVSTEYLVAIEILLKNFIESRLVQRSLKWRGWAHNIMTDEKCVELLELIRITRIGSIENYVELSPEIILLMNVIKISFNTYMSGSEEETLHMRGPKKYPKEEEDVDILEERT